ncbi:MAG: hypothetical protein AAF704_01885 [Cyanobacteria bacterium P01_D01_bin.123]
MSAPHDFSALQLHALALAWEHLNCDWDADCLMNELLAAHYPEFERNRNPVNPTFALQRREDVFEQFLKLCILQGWNAEDKLEWFEEEMRGPIKFRNLLGFRESYAGRYFDREAIGLDTCEGIFQEVNAALQDLEARQFIRVIGKTGLLLMPQGIETARSRFPDLTPCVRGNPYKRTDDADIETILGERRAPAWQATYVVPLRQP